MDSPDYIVEIEGVTATDPRGASARAAGFRDRPWLAIQWRCCGAYSRVYRNSKSTAYEGRCPRCARPVNVPIGPGGTNNRFFTAE